MLEFGKDAIFIWGAYGISAAVIGGLILRAALMKPHD